ncbi:hypothetical protein BC830DRAFT_1087603 [Chytriomyces sp. MP71]|nr:hypothetical protein BC830DRAFT_1087603 [Chytriomyces sp. MP71]
MFALSMADFTRLRTLIDLHRMAALAGDTLFTTNLEATPHSCCNGTSAGMSQPSTSYSKDSLDLPTLDAASLHIPPANATGPVLLQWLRARDRSNRRCGACGESNPPPTWAAVMRAPAPPPVGAGAGAGTGDAMALAEVPVRAALLVCDACGGFYRGLPFFAVRSFLLDVSVFEDATTDLYKQVTSISNRAACLALAETPTHSYTLRLYFTTIGDNTNDNDDADSPDLHSTPISARHLAVTSAATAGHHTRRASDHGLDYTFMPTPSASSSEAAPTESRWSPRALRLTARPGGLFSRMMHRGSATRAATLTSTTATTTTEVATPALHLPVATASHEELKRSGATGESFEFPGSTEVGVAWAPGTVGAASLRRASFSSVSPSVTGGRVLDEVFGESGSLRREGSLGRGREGSLGSPTGSVPTVVGIVSGGVKKMSVQRRMQVASIPNVEFS